MDAGKINRESMITEEQIKQLANEYSDTLEFNICGYNYIDTENAFKAGMKNAIELMQPEWIPVTERLPDNFKAVLIEADFIGKSYMAEITTVATWQNDHWTTDRDMDHDMVEIMVNRWMPLPGPPKAD